MRNSSSLPGLGHAPMADDSDAVADSILQFTARHARERGRGLGSSRSFGGAHWARHQRRCHDHHQEGKTLQDDPERVAGHRIAEDDDAAGDAETLAAALVSAITGTASAFWSPLADA